MVAIIDYNMGNVASVQKALNFLNISSVVTDNHKAISDSDFILLPGVGSFRQGMENLKRKELDKLLTDLVMGEKKSFFGICLGMQLIAKKGTEPEDCIGLDWVDGTIVKIEEQNLRVPHMGWNNIDIKKQGYFDNLQGKDFYFIHSYHFMPDNKDVIAATVEYGGELVAAVQKENIFATQFHPEKSQVAGLSLLKNYFDYVKA
jgi:glutamine amidotransferase